MATIFTKGKGKAWARSVEAAKKRVKAGPALCTRYNAPCSRARQSNVLP